MLKRTPQSIQATLTQAILISIICLFGMAQAHAGVFERIYKLPNAQTMTTENNYQPNIYFLPNLKPTTQEGQQALALLKASNNNKTIENNVKKIKQLIQTAIIQNDPVAQDIQLREK